LAKYSITGIKNASILYQEAFVPDSSMIIRDGKIAKLGLGMSLNLEECQTILNADGLIVIPGLIDTHLHGGGGHEFQEGSNEAVLSIARAHSKFGVTGMVCAVGTSTKEETIKAFSVIRDAMSLETGGARVLGIHWESSFTSPKHKGALDERYQLLPDLEYAKSVCGDFKGSLKIVTLAPELPGSGPLISYLAELGVKISLGHTDASFADAIEARKLGADRVTHVFNAMKGLHHRDPGVPGAAMLGDFYVELIADGYHVDPAIAELIWKTAGSNRTLLMTDATPPVGTTQTSFELREGVVVKIHDGRTWGPGDSLVGSVLSLNAAVRNMCKWTGEPLERIIPLATSNPARSLGIVAPSLEEGSTADIAIMDSDFNARATIVEGRIVHNQL
jgi:N-acetylglucosamine-6-phosphate deacetylase